MWIAHATEVQGLSLGNPSIQLGDAVGAVSGLTTTSIGLAKHAQVEASHLHASAAQHWRSAQALMASPTGAQGPLTGTHDPGCINNQRRWERTIAQGSPTGADQPQQRGHNRSAPH